MANEIMQALQAASVLAALLTLLWLAGQHARSSQRERPALAPRRSMAYRVVPRDALRSMSEDIPVYIRLRGQPLSPQATLERIL